MKISGKSVVFPFIGLLHSTSKYSEAGSATVSRVVGSGGVALDQRDRVGESMMIALPFLFIFSVTAV